MLVFGACSPPPPPSSHPSNTCVHLVRWGAYISGFLDVVTTRRVRPGRALLRRPVGPRPRLPRLDVPRASLLSSLLLHVRRRGCCLHVRREGFDRRRRRRAQGQRKGGRQRRRRRPRGRGRIRHGPREEGRRRLRGPAAMGPVAIGPEGSQDGGVGRSPSGHRGQGRGQLLPRTLCLPVRARCVPGSRSPLIARAAFVRQHACPHRSLSLSLYPYIKT